MAIRTNQNQLGEVPNVKTPVKTNKLKNLEDLIEEEENANKNTNNNNIDNNSVSNIDNISDLGKDLWRKDGAIKIVTRPFLFHLSFNVVRFLDFGAAGAK